MASRAFSFYSQKDGRKQIGFHITAADALTILGDVDLIIRNLDRDTRGLEKEDLILPGVDVTLRLAGQGGNGTCRSGHDRPPATAGGSAAMLSSNANSTSTLSIYQSR